MSFFKEMDTKKVVALHFGAAVLLFQLQVIFGLISVLHYVFGDFFYNHLFDFHVSRTYHTNLLIVWLLVGFMGATYHLIADEGQTEIRWPKLAFWTLAAFIGGGVVGLVLYVFRIWQGREFVELPWFLDIAVVLVMISFLWNVFVTYFKARRRTSIQAVMLIGFTLAAILYIPANLFFANESVQSFYWWWTVHLWVEGVWELIMGSMLAFLLVKMTGVDREVMEKWLYIVVALTFFTGILGLGHHYYWIGTPRYWLIIGGLFSALEPLAFFGMILYALFAKRRESAPHPNRSAMIWAITCTVVATIGVMHGMAQTLPEVNQYTHGTHTTAAHGHLAFFGAYGMINLAFITYMIPVIHGLPVEKWKQGFNRWSFYLMLVGILGIGTANTIGGIVQVIYERIMGQPYMLVQEKSSIIMSYQLWLFFGLVFATGSILFAVDFFKPRIRSKKESEIDIPLVNREGENYA